MLKIKSTTTGPNLRKMNYCFGPPICTSIELEIHEQIYHG